MENEFVITYIEKGIPYSVLWKSPSQGEAVLSFWKSYAPIDAEKVTDVRIYRLVEIMCDTTNPLL